MEQPFATFADRGVAIGLGKFGGEGSGHFGHKGREGEVGGSLPASEGLTIRAREPGWKDELAKFIKGGRVDKVKIIGKGLRPKTFPPEDFKTAIDINDPQFGNTIQKHIMTLSVDRKDVKDLSDKDLENVNKILLDSLMRWEDLPETKELHKKSPNRYQTQRHKIERDAVFYGKRIVSLPDIVQPKLMVNGKLLFDPAKVSFSESFSNEISVGRKGLPRQGEVPNEPLPFNSEVRIFKINLRSNHRVPRGTNFHPSVGWY